MSQNDFALLRRALTFDAGTFVERRHTAGHAAVDRIENRLAAFEEFFDAHWEVEKGVTDFNLHSDAVERMRRAFDVCWEYRKEKEEP